MTPAAVLFQELIEIDDWLRIEKTNYFKHCPLFNEDGMSFEIKYLKEWLEYSDELKAESHSTAKSFSQRIIGAYARFPEPDFQNKDLDIAQDLTSPLVIAFLSKKTQALPALLREGAVNTTNKFDRLIIHAIRKKDLELFNVVLSNSLWRFDVKKALGVCLQRLKDYSEDAFDLAVLTAFVTAFHAIQVNRTIDGTTDSGENITSSPLGYAVFNNLQATAAILLSHPLIDIFNKDSMGKTPLERAIETKNEPMKKLLLKHIGDRLYDGAISDKLTSLYRDNAMGVLSKPDFAKYILERAKSYTNHQEAVDFIDPTLTALKTQGSPLRGLLLGLALHRVLNNLIGELQTERSRRENLQQAQSQGTTHTFINSPAASSSRTRTRDDSNVGIEMEKMSFDI